MRRVAKTVGKFRSEKAFSQIDGITKNAKLSIVFNSNGEFVFDLHDYPFTENEKLNTKFPLELNAR